MELSFGDGDYGILFGFYDAGGLFEGDDEDLGLFDGEFCVDGDDGG